MPDRDPFQSLWANQKQEEFTMSLADIQRRAARLQWRVRLRNWIEYGAAALVIAGFGYIAYLAPVPLVQLGSVLIILGALYVCWKLATLAGAATKDDAQSWADFHRAELVRQRDALQSVWRWYLGPFVPGALIFLAGVALGLGDAPLAAKAITFATGAGFMGIVFVAIAQLNAIAAKRISREIDALDTARREGA